MMVTIFGALVRFISTWKFYVAFCVNLTEFIWKKRHTHECLSPSKKGPRELTWQRVPPDISPSFVSPPTSQSELSETLDPTLSDCQGISNLTVKKFEAAQARGFPRSFPLFCLGFLEVGPLNKKQYFCQVSSFCFLNIGTSQKKTSSRERYL